MLGSTGVIGPLDGPSFNSYDMHIPDIRPEDLAGKISRIMGTQSLSIPENASPRWPAEGKLLGLEHRILFTLPVALGDRAINAHFVFATGAPFSFLAEWV